MLIQLCGTTTEDYLFCRFVFLLTPFVDLFKRLLFLTFRFVFILFLPQLDNSFTTLFCCPLELIAQNFFQHIEYVFNGYEIVHFAWIVKNGSNMLNTICIMVEGVLWQTEVLINFIASFN